MSTPLIALSPEELEAMVRRVVREELEAKARPFAPRPLTEADMAEARKNLRRFGRGK